MKTDEEDTEKLKPCSHIILACLSDLGAAGGGVVPGNEGQRGKTVWCQQAAPPAPCFFCPNKGLLQAFFSWARCSVDQFGTRPWSLPEPFYSWGAEVSSRTG